MSTTSIEWTDRTWNPIRGCSRVSAGCDNCYAMGQAHRFAGAGKPFEGLTTIRRGKVDWIGVARFIPEQLDAPLRWHKPQRVFVNSMSDLFHESLSTEEIAAVFGVMAACPQHTFQVLTKRPKRAAEFFRALGHDPTGGTTCAAAQLLYPDNRAAHASFELHAEAEAWPLQNVWLGASVENQATADDRLSMLLEIPAAVRFVSMEPLLEKVSIWAFLKGDVRDRSLAILKSPPMPGLDWVIVGGESGPGARPFDIEWARYIVDQCKTSGVPCFVKQVGARAIDSSLRDVFGYGYVHYTGLPEDSRVVEAQKQPGYRVVPHDVSRLLARDRRKGGDMSEWPEELRVREFPKQVRV